MYRWACMKKGDKNYNGLLVDKGSFFPTQLTD